MTPLPSVSAPLRVPERSPWILPGIMLGIGLAALILAEAVPAWSRLSYFVPFTFLGNSLAPLPYDGAVVYLGANHPLWVIVPIAVAATLLIEVGRLRRRLQLREELDESLILLVSDHGASQVHTHLDLADWFRAQGVPTLSHPVVWERRPSAAVMVAGNGSAMVYARPGVPRADRWPVERLRMPAAFGSREDLIARLAREPSVAFVAAESESGGIWLESEQGSARISSRGGNVAYQPLSGDQLLLGGPWSATTREWLEATWDSPFPDAPFHLMDQFRTQRSGDLLVIAREGYDFRVRFEVPEHRAGHGSLIRAHMQTPVWSSQPIPSGPVRTVDLFPAMLDWLSVDVPEGIDGEPVWLPGERRRLRKPARAASFTDPNPRVRSSVG